MLILMIIELCSFIGAVISSYLCWGPLTSWEMVEYFGPPIKTEEKLCAEALHERKRWAGFHAEVLRAFLITLFGLIVIPFYLPAVSILYVLSSPFFQWIFLVIVLLIFLWNIYLGPRFFAMKFSGEFKFFSKVHFKKFIRPYWAWLFYPILVWAGIGLTTIILIINNISIDINRLQSYYAEISSISLIAIENVQFAIIRLHEFGDWISITSQKYMLTTILIFIYVIIEQRSSMRYTILDNSVERLKYMVWIGFLFTIGFSLIVLPLQYDRLHSLIRIGLEQLTQNSLIPPDHYNDVLSSQQRLGDQDLRWLLLHIVTGYGNLITLSIVGFFVFLWRLFFDKVPLRYILLLLIPAYVITKINRFAENFNIDMNIKGHRALQRKYIRRQKNDPEKDPRGS